MSKIDLMLPDLDTASTTCATRIMDRMEMCRGSAILKDDIAAEVKRALTDAVDAARAQDAKMICGCIAEDFFADSDDRVIISS